MCGTCAARSDEAGGGSAVVTPAPASRSRIGWLAAAMGALRRLVDYDVTPDGQRFLLAPDAPREAGDLSVVLNWQALLR